MKRTIALLLAIMMVMSCMTSITFVSAKETFGTVIEYTETRPTLSSFVESEWPALKKQTNKTPRAFAMMYDEDYLYIAVTTEDCTTVENKAGATDAEFVQIYLNAGSSAAANSGNYTTLSNSFRLCIPRKKTGLLNNYNAVAIGGTEVKAGMSVWPTATYRADKDILFNTTNAFPMEAIICIPWAGLGVATSELTEGYEMNVDIMYHDVNAGTGFGFTPVAYTLGAKPGAEAPVETPEATAEETPEATVEETPEATVEETPEATEEPEVVVPTTPAIPFAATAPTLNGLNAAEWPEFTLSEAGVPHAYSMMYDNDYLYVAVTTEDKTDNRPYAWYEGDFFQFYMNFGGEVAPDYASVSTLPNTLRFVIDRYLANFNTNLSGVIARGTEVKTDITFNTENADIYYWGEGTGEDAVDGVFAFSWAA
ncbi:MAG: hypothetical protein IKZ25_02660, partial [Clostridia bacterium]|nr:hypothetical protein [Clostridia bacterium]